MGHFHFLNLSAELRNRIYEFATEDYGSTRKAYLNKASEGLYGPSRMVPRAVLSLGRTAPGDYRPPGKFFALTQTCRQIRAEYRPIWFRNCQVEIEYSRLWDFVDAFLPTAAELECAPKRLLLEWCHSLRPEERKHECLSHNITVLVRMRAYCPSFHCEFIDIADGFGYCDEWPYTLMQAELANHSNEAWFEDIREGNITVYCNFETKSHHVTVKILWKNQECKALCEPKAAREVLLAWGLFDLGKKVKKEVSFILAHEEKQRPTEVEIKVFDSILR